MNSCSDCDRHAVCICGFKGCLVWLCSKCVVPHYLKCSNPDSNVTTPSNRCGLVFRPPSQILTKSLWVKELKSSSVICGFQYTNELEKVVLEGEVTLVNVTITEDRNTIKAEAFNEEMKQKISKFVIQTT